MIKKVLALAACLLAAPVAHAWAPLGHSVIGELAERQLTPEAATEVQRLLHGEAEPTLAGIANWADTLRQSDPQRFRATSRWHYVNYPEGSCSFDAERDCKDGHCIVAATEQQLAVLADRGRPLAERRDALKFVVHFIGDAHQPMHAGNRDDAGGNRFQISLTTAQPPEAYAREHYRDGVMGTNLHAVLDYYVPGVAGLEVADYAEALMQPSWPPLATVAGNPVLWSQESCQLLDAWGVYPQQHKHDDAFLKTMQPLVERRLRQAGHRLALILNDVLGR
ncbi:MAG: S1/P1 nuclease [Pseudoxanthomonas suwonensis]|nr:S1/P1 nuclease [Pseudoxanthomonas suwonensis]